MNPSWGASFNAPGWFLDPVSQPSQQQSGQEHSSHQSFRLPQHESAASGSPSLASKTQQQQQQQSKHQQPQQQHQVRFNQQQTPISTLLEHQMGSLPGHAAGPSQTGTSKQNLTFQGSHQAPDKHKGLVSGHFNAAWPAMPDTFPTTPEPGALHGTSTLPLSLADLPSGLGNSSSNAAPSLADHTDPGAFLNFAPLDAAQHANPLAMSDSPAFFRNTLPGSTAAADADIARVRAARKASPFTASNYRVQHGLPGMTSSSPGPGHLRSFSVPTRFGGYPGSALQAVPEGSMQPPPMRTAGTIGCSADYNMDDDSLDLDSLAEPFDFLHDHPHDHQPSNRSQSTDEPSRSGADMQMGQRGDPRSASTSMLGFPPPGRLNYLTPPELRKGKGGRQPALDPRLDPNVDPKRAKRILANRLSAARSKMKQKTHVDGLKERASTLTKQKVHLQEEVKTLEKACEDTARENDAVMKQLQGLREQVKQQNMLNAKLIDERASLMRAAAESEARTAQLQQEQAAPAANSFNSLSPPQADGSSPVLQPSQGFPQQSSQSPQRQQPQQHQHHHHQQQHHMQQHHMQQQQQQRQGFASQPQEPSLEKQSSSLSQLWSGMAMDLQPTSMPSFEQSFLDPSPMLPAHSGSFPSAFPAPASTAF